MLLKTKHMNVVLLAFIRQELSLVSYGRRKYNKRCGFKNLQVVWLYVAWLCMHAGLGGAYEQ